MCPPEDIVQHTFVELISAWRLTQPIEYVAAWLLGAARIRAASGRGIAEAV
jgi:hypothetical protein